MTFSNCVGMSREKKGYGNMEEKAMSKRQSRTNI